uniref:FYVE-type domain-containing protein n=1 Tax=Hyaloperonospora arabidopsidis (strain Emoy2) TaxID=559515 RepID=M4BBR1_HYAAE
MDFRKKLCSWDFSSSRAIELDNLDRESYRCRSAVSSGRDSSGLHVQLTSASRQKKLVFSDSDICEDVLATMSKLQAAVLKDQDKESDHGWKLRSGKNGVEVAEMKPYLSLVQPHNDIDLLHAVMAKTELRCHLNEALSVLLHQESDSYDSTMKALYGKQFKTGEVLFHQSVGLHTPSSIAKQAGEAPNQAVISVISARMGPRSSLKMRLQSRQNRTQQLVFSTYTHQHADKKHAMHLMKTVPKDVYNQILPDAEESVIRTGIDHIGIGFDLHFTPNSGGSIRQRTRIFAHAYASDKPTRAFSKHVSNDPEVDETTCPAHLTRRRAMFINSEARGVMRMLTESLEQFDRVIRRRRFGFQSFIYFPQVNVDPLFERCCLICNKSFSLFRREFYCQLCGHMVCNDCSEQYDVEVRIGEIRKNRCCRLCVVRVDACKFDDEDLLPALGPIIVETPSEDWIPIDKSILNSSSRDDNGDQNESNEEIGLMERVNSEDTEAGSRSLETLGNLLSRSCSTLSSASTAFSSKLLNGASRRKTKLLQSKTRNMAQVHRVLNSVEEHLNKTLSKAKLQMKVDACDVSDRTRDYKYKYDASQVSHEDIPLAPKPEVQKDARRIELIKGSGALRADYDRSALNLIAEVAAKRLNCPIGVVSMIDDKQFHAIGHYNLPAEAHLLPRNEVLCTHSVYAEKPLVVKNPQRDMRFSKMPCVNDFGVKFYAGFPLRASSGEVIGNLCALDGVAHNNISTKDYATMETLAQLASDLLIQNFSET